jgi:hypothetical protein
MPTTPGQWVETQVANTIANAPVSGGYVIGEGLPMDAPAVVDKLPRFQLEDLTDGNLRVVVASRSRGLSGGGRSPRKQEIVCQVMVVKKVDKDLTELQPLLELMYAIDMLLANLPNWVSASNDPEYDVDALDTQLIFKSVITVNFTAIT